MKLVIVGSIALDDVKTPSGEVHNSLGGSAIYASIASSKLIKTGIVGVVGEDFTSQHFRILDEEGIDISGLEKAEGLTFKWKGEYTDFNKAQTIDTQLNVFGDFDPKIPKSYQECPYLFLGNIHPILQLKVLSEMKKTKCVACDTMNFWIEKTPELLKEVIKQVNILFINEDEIKQLTGETNIYRASEKVLKSGPELLVIKRGEHGAVAISQDRMFYTPVYPIQEVIDPTGAGDSFAGGFLSILANSDSMDWPVIQKAMLRGTVTASFDIQSFSVDSLKNAEEKAINERINELLTNMKIEI